jgi:hypothetical protein
MQTDVRIASQCELLVDTTREITGQALNVDGGMVFS